MNAQRTRISAYALLQEHDSGRILLCRLSSELPRWEGHWTLPGGGLNFGESPEDAVVREVEEETGLLIEVGAIATIDSLFDCSGESDFHGIRIIYHAKIVGGSLRCETSGSTDACEWHDLNSSPEVAMVDLAELGVELARQEWSAISMRG
ncbi:NUDIX domain-containing protein [Phragmitibacter flavus]|uniref:NUDIX domain-containing protein n=1 Tax=Phragmitibacter flavus TaxID=2576071 RepID=A0A5R8K7R6_9BACT|nr:NUDIX domain-containing protein [Phragmitibacter flavus]TLD68383.1 NUDIX domain-containing protein [Phragmitibacter flavus]